MSDQFQSWWAGRMARHKQGKVRSATRVTKLMVTVILRDFRDGTIPSKFAYEATFIAELRASLCLTGWAWPWPIRRRGTSCRRR